MFFGKALAFCVLWILSALVFAAPQGYIYDASGDVTVQAGSGQRIPASKNQAFDRDTLILTGENSYAVLKFEDGQVVMLKQNSSFQVRDYQFQADAPEKGSVFFALLRGGARLITGLIGSRNRAGFKMDTPTMTIGIRGTDFAVEIVNPVYGHVYAGEIGAINSAGTLTVGTGQYFTVANLNTLGVIVPVAQIPLGVLQFPAIPLPPPAPGLPTGLTPVGGAGIGSGLAVGIGAAAAAAAAAASGGGGGGGGVVVIPTPSHH